MNKLEKLKGDIEISVRILKLENQIKELKTLVWGLAANIGGPYTVKTQMEVAMDTGLEVVGRFEEQEAAAKKREATNENND